MISRVPKGLALGLLSTALAASLVGNTALAESDCKGLEKGPCEKKSSCYWVDGYTRKDGVKVSAYCRTSSKQSGSSKDTDKEKKSK